MTESTPILSWNLKMYNKENKENKMKGKDKMKDCSIIQIKWCPQKPSAFFVFDSHGYCYYFDLLQKTFDPLYIQFLSNTNENENIGKNDKFGKNFQPDISRCRPGTKTVYIATNIISTNTENKSNNKNKNKNDINVTIRIVSEDLLQKNVRGIKDVDQAIDIDENKFRDSMAVWSSRIVTPQITVLLKDLSINNQSETKDNRK